MIIIVVITYKEKRNDNNSRKINHTSMILKIT